MTMLLAETYRSFESDRIDDAVEQRTKSSRRREVRNLIEAIGRGQRDTGVHDLPVDLAREIDRILAYGRETGSRAGCRAI
jgi:hypothetical protein